MAELKCHPQAGHIGVVVISQLADLPDDIAKCIGTNPFSGHHGEWRLEIEKPSGGRVFA